MHTHLKIAEILTHLMDEQFSIGGHRFGFDPLLDFIPGLGDVFAFLISIYLVWIGTQMGLPDDKIGVMVRNVIFDFILGLIPVVGTVGDFFFKANVRNLRILKEHAERIVEGQEVKAEAI